MVEAPKNLVVSRSFHRQACLGLRWAALLQPQPSQAECAAKQSDEVQDAEAAELTRAHHFLPCQPTFTIMHLLRSLPEEGLDDLVQHLVNPGRQPNCDRCINRHGRLSGLDPSQLAASIYEPLFPW
jgi:hypothetical protein